MTWASDNPMKEHYASLNTRHHLLEILVQELKLPQVEIRQELSSPQTIKTLEIASESWPKSDLVFIIGSDLVGQIPKWFKAKELLVKARLGIAPREGWPVNQDDLKVLRSMGAEIDILPLKIPATASSDIRVKPDVSQIPQAILPIILQEKLYGL
ncbi:Nicotinate-nucleotide adenylyltransferase bacterial NadD family [Prochlorococcus sp. MIT 0601]|nr:Nicotinate-nucleotide adenylyltransferase bacterial NadD family [Prochlorococcus sp. MIT 0601]